MDKLDGVVSQRVGYTGGDAEEPTYGSVCGGDGHTEAVKIEFDPNVISDQQLRDTCWAAHNPSGSERTGQNKSASSPTGGGQAAGRVRGRRGPRGPARARARRAGGQSPAQRERLKRAGQDLPRSAPRRPAARFERHAHAAPLGLTSPLSCPLRCNPADLTVT